MTRDVLIGLDAGGSFVKCTVFDLTSDQTVTRGRQVPVAHVAPGHNERDPQSMWSRLAEAIREALVALPGGGVRVAAVGVTGHGNGLYLVDRQGTPTRAAVLASDTRARDVVRAWQADGRADALTAATGNAVWPGQPAPLLAWMREHDPEALANAVAAPSCKDYVRARLTGHVATELTDQSCSGLFDNVRLTYAHEPLRACGLGDLMGLLPEPVRSDAVVGEVTHRAAQATGLPAGTPVVAGTVDNVAMHLGSGVLDGDRLCASAGTWSVNQRLLPRREFGPGGEVDRIRPLAACLSVDEQLALVIEASPTSASTLSWALDNVMSGVRSVAAALGRDAYEVCLERAGAAPLRDDDPMFLPFLDGSRDDAGARAAWIGMSSSHDDGHLLRALVEGVCFEHRRHLERLAPDLAGVAVRLSGGAAKSAAWCQLFADTLGCTVEVPGAEELGALGAAVVAGTATGVFAGYPEGLDALLDGVRSYTPSARAAQYEPRFARYRALVALLGASTS